MAAAGKGHGKALVGQALATHTTAGTDRVQKVGGSLLQHTRADARQHVVAGASFQDDGIDAGVAEQRAEHEPGRPCADNGNLCAHVPTRDLCIRPEDDVGAERAFAFSFAHVAG